MQSAGIDLSAIIAAACRYLGIEEKKLSRRFNVDRSVISRAARRVRVQEKNKSHRISDYFIK